MYKRQILRQQNKFQTRWIQSNKAHAFSGANACADCPSGCGNEELGFSARLMWYNENGVDADVASAQLASYSYWGEEDEGERCGTYWYYEGVEVVAGQWYELEMYLKMNSAEGMWRLA